MNLYLKYGSYSHAVGECAVRWEQEPLRSDGDKTGVKHIITINGRLHADTQAALTTAIAALESAYAVDGKDIGLYFDNNQPTGHYLKSSDCSGGVYVVKGPSYLEDRGAEYSTYRTYQIVLEAIDEKDDSGLISWSETVTMIGGGRQRGFLEVLNGQPQEQLLKQQTVYRAMQTGQAVARQGYCNPPPPFAAGAFQNDKSQVAYTSPKRTGTNPPAYTEFQTAWNYVFESASPISGYPTPWPQ